jgi:hypothetical protein
MLSFVANIIFLFNENIMIGESACRTKKELIFNIWVEPALQQSICYLHGLMLSFSWLQFFQNFWQIDKTYLAKKMM